MATLDEWNTLPVPDSSSALDWSTNSSARLVGTTQSGS